MSWWQLSGWSSLSCSLLVSSGPRRVVSITRLWHVVRLFTPTLRFIVLVVRFLNCSTGHCVCQTVFSFVPRTSICLVRVNLALVIHIWNVDCLPSGRLLSISTDGTFAWQWSPQYLLPCLLKLVGSCHQAFRFSMFVCHICPILALSWWAT